LVNEKQRAIQNGDPSFTVYLEELIRLDNIYGLLHEDSGNTINQTFSLNGETIEIVGLPILDIQDPVIGYKFKGATKRQHGTRQYKTYDVHLLGASRNKIIDVERLNFQPEILKIRFSTIQGYNDFIREINKSINY